LVPKTCHRPWRPRNGEALRLAVGDGDDLHKQSPVQTAPVRLCPHRIAEPMGAIVALCIVDAVTPDDAVSEALEHLSERDQDIVRLRFGVDDGKAWTRNEVGVKYGVTGERIRQIEVKTLAKLRQLDRALLLDENLDQS
jgi:Sigma-70, region 4